MIITVSGPPGSGKSTFSRILSKRLKIEVISAGDIFRKLAGERGLGLAELGILAERDPEIDKMIDTMQKKIAEEKDNIIIEGRLSGFLINAGLKIWLKAPLEIRAARIASREKIPIEEAVEETKTREKCEAIRYKKYYGIDTSNLSIYDMVLDSSKWNQGDLAWIVETAIKTLGKE